ncbi:MAG: O-antigen ligase family protein [Parcubacteria group bacterium]|nr:O-antigen ligase family protein [Parcubacteria group bacterium]
MLNVEYYLNRIIKYGLYAILLMPLAFWPKALFPFLTPKFILFQILVEIVFAAWLILRLLKSDFSRSPTSRSPEVGLSPFRRSLEGRQTPKSDFRNYLFLSLLGFLAVSFISALFGVDFSRSFWGIGARMTGLFAELHFFAWFLVLVSFFRMKSDFPRSPTSRSPEVGLQILKSDFNSYIDFSFFVALAVAATAFYQNLTWGLSLGYGIFNNPTFVAPYLIFHFFWGIYQTFMFSKSDLRSPTSRSPEVGLQVPRSDFKKWFFGAGALLLLFVIIFAQIRGAVLGLLVGIFALGIGLIFSDIFKRRFRVVLSAIYIFLIVGVAGFWYLRDNPAVLKFSPIKRVTGISLQETTVQTRFLAWQVAINGAKDKLLLGTGPENFNYLFNAHYNPKFLKFGGGGFGETWFDKPHNAFLEVLAETGIIGILAYILVWIAAGLSLYKLFKRNEKLLSIVLASAFLSYLVTVFFSFDSFGSWFGLFLFLAFLASQEVRLRGFLKSDFNIGNVQISRIANKYSQLASLAIAGGLLALLSANYGIWRANTADADALRTFPRNTERGIALFKKTLNYFTPYKSEYRLDLFMTVGNAIQVNYPMPNLEETINFVLAESDKMIVDHPKDAAYYTSLVKLYDILGEKGRDSQILEVARSYGEKSLELSPNRQETLFYLTKNSLLENNTKAAVAYAIKATEADPSINLSHWYYGLALIADGQQEKGVVEIKKAFELGYKPQNEIERNFIKQLGF